MARTRAVPAECCGEQKQQQFRARREGVLSPAGGCAGQKAVSYRDLTDGGIQPLRCGQTALGKLNRTQGQMNEDRSPLSLDPMAGAPQHRAILAVLV